MRTKPLSGVLLVLVITVALANPGVRLVSDDPTSEGLTEMAGVVEDLSLPARASHSPGSIDGVGQGGDGDGITVPTPPREPEVPSDSADIEVPMVPEVPWVPEVPEIPIEPEEPWYPVPDPSPTEGWTPPEFGHGPQVDFWDEISSERSDIASSKGIVVPIPPTPKVDVLFCLDTTGSMGDEIEVVKATILDIADFIASGNPAPDVRYGLVVFRDIGDEYVTIVYDFMEVQDLAKILFFTEARRGGDYPESVSEALWRSVHDVSWDLEGANCAIYLIGDAPPHTDYLNGFDHLEAARDAADMGIVINSIGCSGIEGSETEFMEVAEITGGTFLYLEYNMDINPPGGTGSGDGGVHGEEDTDGTFRTTDGVGTGTGEGSTDEDGDSDSDTDGTDSYTKRGSTYGEGEGEGQGQGNNLDTVLAGMIQGQAEAEGVEYGD
jgi:hypothetical protein